ncbi:DUF1569 domain-containing protein [Ferruginibacter sp. SUN106]|uniref:DUF1569 domain-containing protein n=1 Tax=Ferruginibacter sp. SUN106 TaxID=2978348 RepID=UPI003D368AD4
MKSVFDESTRTELTGRINLLTENSSAQWGKMNVYQMLKHCTMWDEWVTGTDTKKYPRAFLGRIVGRMALKSITKDETPIQRNAVSLAAFIIKETNGDIDTEKKKWITLIASYAHFSNPGFVHTFFGKMTTEQIGYFAYKHADHHLRQFNV